MNLHHLTGHRLPNIRIIPAATSSTVIVSADWLSLPLASYTIAANRNIGEALQVLCPEIVDQHNETVSSLQEVVLTNLEEFSLYTVTVVAMFTAYGIQANRTGTAVFTTLSSGMCFFHVINSQCACP